MKQPPISESSIIRVLVQGQNPIRHNPAYYYHTYLVICSERHLAKLLSHSTCLSDRPSQDESISTELHSTYDNHTQKQREAYRPKTPNHAEGPQHSPSRHLMPRTTMIDILCESCRCSLSACSLPLSRNAP